MPNIYISHHRIRVELGGLGLIPYKLTPQNLELASKICNFATKVAKFLLKTQAKRVRVLHLGKFRAP